MKLPPSGDHGAKRQNPLSPKGAAGNEKSPSLGTRQYSRMILAFPLQTGLKEAGTHVFRCFVPGRSEGRACPGVHSPPVPPGVSRLHAPKPPALRRVFYAFGNTIIRRYFQTVD